MLDIFICVFWCVVLLFLGANIFLVLGANIFLTSDGPLKLGDFGSAVKLKNQLTMPGEVNNLVGTAGECLLPNTRS